MTARGQPVLLNILLSVLGALFTASGLVLCAYLAYDCWGYAGPLEYTMGVLLLGCAAFGFGLIAATHPAVKAALRRWWKRGVEAFRAPVRRHEDR